MIKIENVEVTGWEAAIRGARNPLNSWDKMDSVGYALDDYYRIGANDLNLMKRLAKAGNDHGKYLRMITVYADLTAPLYWWKEFDTYKVGTVANSCSTMHKIQSKEFTRNDFSTEHLGLASMAEIDRTLEILNINRQSFLETNDKTYWWQMIQLLPSSYNQKRTVMLNYAVLKNMYHSRKTHKLDEWRTFCTFIEQLPYSDLITGDRK